jgi:hypothetical protein
MTTAKNFAAWSPGPKADLEVREAPMYVVDGDEILIKVGRHIMIPLARLIMLLLRM